MPKKEPRIEVVNDEGRGAIGYVRDKVAGAKDTTEDFVKEHPWTSVAIAAAVGAGVALGVAALVGRRREDRTFLEKLRDLF